MTSPTEGGTTSSSDLCPGQAMASSPRASAPSTPKSPLASLGSLRGLRSKLSLGSLSGRSRSASPKKEARRKAEMTRLRSRAISASPTKVPVNQRQSLFRPLSILTSAITPFDFDVVGALESVRQNANFPASASTENLKPVPDTTSETMAPRKPYRAASQTPLSHDVKEDPKDDGKTIMPDERSFTTPSHPLFNQRAAFRSTSQNFSRSTALTDLKSKMPQQAVIKDEFKNLVKLPPPDISQHPMFSNNPESSVSDAPLMATPTTAEEIRQYNQEMRTLEVERLCRSKLGPSKWQGGKFLGPQHLDNKEPLPTFMNPAKSVREQAAQQQIPDAETPFQHGRKSSEFAGRYVLAGNLSRLRLDSESTGTDTYENGAEGLPFPTLPPLPKTPSGSAKTATTPISDSFDQKKTGFRKMTDLLKGREKTPESLTPRVIDQGNLSRPDLERYLRVTLSHRSYDYDPAEGYPRHPNTSRGWKSRNLHCTNCMEECCAVCGRACCAYKAAVNALKTHKDNPESLRFAQEKIVEIAHLFPYGTEVPTFLQCTKGDEIGCGKVVCPDCCGVCPNPICCDVQCRKCKKQPWSECLWHDSDMNRLAL